MKDNKEKKSYLMPITDLSNTFYKRIENMTEEDMKLYQEQLKALPKLEPRKNK